MPITFTLRPVGRVRSSLKILRDAPCFYTEGAPPAFLEIKPQFRRSLRGIQLGDDLIIVTWLHRGRRHVQSTYPEDDKTSPRSGVFRTRSPNRPNPIGLHRCRVTEVRTDGLLVDALEAIDGTPIVDIKPAIR
jgi:tRNA-Thr(GGU) m(6)t(6)A37 methyltransferase TsaA